MRRHFIEQRRTGKTTRTRGWANRRMPLHRPKGVINYSSKERVVTNRGRTEQRTKGKGGHARVVGGGRLHKTMPLTMGVWKQWKKGKSCVHRSEGGKSHSATRESGERRHRRKHRGGRRIIPALKSFRPPRENQYERQESGTQGGQPAKSRAHDRWSK